MLSEKHIRNLCNTTAIECICVDRQLIMNATKLRLHKEMFAVIVVVFLKIIYLFV